MYEYVAIVMADSNALASLEAVRMTIGHGCTPAGRVHRRTHASSIRFILLTDHKLKVLTIAYLVAGVDSLPVTETDHPALHLQLGRVAGDLEEFCQLGICPDNSQAHSGAA